MIYKTIHILNLTTGQPFEFEVPDQEFKEFQLLKQRQVGHDGLDSKAVQRVTEDFESGLFPSHKEVSRLFVGNGYTDELVAKILLDFGVLLDEVVSIIKNKRFRRNVYACFKSIAHDSGRAAVAMRKVYNSALYYRKQLRVVADLAD